MKPLNRYHRRICEELSRWGIAYVEEFPVGRYFVDIYLPELARFVEIDGPSHMRRRDARRDEEIRQLFPDVDIVHIKVGTPIAKARERILG